MKSKIRRYALFLLIPAVLFALAATAEPKPVDVRLTEYAIEMPQTLPAGPTTFVLHNLGHKTHSFKLEGPGITEMEPTLVKPGKTASVQVTLQPGEYNVICPIGSHAAKGMTLKLVVAAKP